MLLGVGYPGGKNRALVFVGVGNPPTTKFSILHNFWVWGLAARCYTCYTPLMTPSEILQTLLHDTLILGLKSQSFHWNVTGPYFGPLHNLFQSQYEELFGAADTIAERLRALGEYPHPHNSNEGGDAVEAIPKKPPTFKKMLEILAVENKKLGLFCNTTAELVEDEATSNLLAERAHAHEKAAWMLRSHLE